ncbi:uncharacterized protein LOC132904169 [Amyelois transitella]|uniref:uncharacterized protein LOC132904169 n=1 Tax=Amyelois transitella TaxID=680683 RepID=UPI00298F54D2|nr:uncharacterized protein LOC132904169 [Amyelois transitella]
MDCANCNEPVLDGAQCTVCKSYYDFKCAGITKTAYKALGTGRSKSSWKCSPCCTKKDSVTDSLISKLDSLGNQLDTIQSDIKGIKCSCEVTNTKLESLGARLDGVDLRVTGLEGTTSSLVSQVDSILEQAISRDQWTRLSNVEIKGVPVKPNENLFDIVAKIGDVIGYAVPKCSLSYVSRIPTRNNKEKSVIATFVNRYAKEDFVAAARLKKVLTAQDIGFSSRDSRVYVNDHLCPEYKKLLNDTKALAKERGFQYVWVKFAKIHVRRNDKSNTIVINSSVDLNKLR